MFASRQFRLQKLVALAILFWAAFDLAVPGLCADDEFHQATLGTQSVATEKPASENPASPELDDCWCCCSHIAPTGFFFVQRSFDSVRLNSFLVSSQYSGWLRSPYHPPRS